MMRVLYTILIASLTIQFFPSYGQQIEVYVRNCTFVNPGNGPYVETSLLIQGNTIQYNLGENGLYSGSVEIELYFKQQGEIKAFEKYILSSREMEDTVERFVSMVDLRRIQLKEGTYEISGTFTDVNNPENKAIYNDRITLAENPEKVQFSDVSLVDQYTRTIDDNIYSKHGMDLIPYVHNFFPSYIEQINFYVELYNSDKILNGDDFLLSYYLEDLKGEKIDQFAGYKKMKGLAVNPFFRTMLIKTLPTGNYYLVLEARDQKNELINSKRFFFQRSNQDFAANATSDPGFIENSFVNSFNEKEMVASIESLVPIAHQNETQTIVSLVKSENIEDIQRYFLSFWLNRSPHDPKSAWEAYKKEVKIVEYNYATTIEHGFETPRGYIYLKYGNPNEIHSPNESGGKEYEIWHYYSLDDGQSNVKFVFYNPTLIPNHYELIHSTAIGEINDSQWRQKIYKDFDRSTDPDRTNFRDHFGSDIDDAFDGF